MKVSVPGKLSPFAFRRWSRVARIFLETASSAGGWSPPSDTLSGAREAATTAPSPRCRLPSDTKQLGPPSRPNRRGKEEGDPRGSQLRPSAPQAAWDMRFSGQWLGQPAAQHQVPGFSLSEQKPQCFPHKLGNWLAPFFLSSSGPLWPPEISPSLCPPSDWSPSSALGCSAHPQE